MPTQSFTGPFHDYVVQGCRYTDQVEGEYLIHVGDTEFPEVWGLFRYPGRPRLRTQRVYLDAFEDYDAAITKAEEWLQYEKTLALLGAKELPSE